MKKSELDLTLLKNSLNTLKECYNDMLSLSDERLQTYVKDSCIKRFEYTYETAKKLMNKYLKKEFDKQNSDLTINNIFREMYALGLIDNFQNWNDYRQKRNTIAPEYDLNLTYPIIDIVPDFIKDIEYFIEHIEKVLVDDIN